MNNNNTAESCIEIERAELELFMLKLFDQLSPEGRAILVAEVIARLPHPRLKSLP